MKILVDRMPENPEACPYIDHTFPTLCLLKMHFGDVKEKDFQCKIGEEGFECKFFRPFLAHGERLYPTLQKNVYEKVEVSVILDEEE